MNLEQRIKVGMRVKLTQEKVMFYRANHLDAEYVDRLARPAVVADIKRSSKHNWTRVFVRYEDGATESFYPSDLTELP